MPTLTDGLQEIHGVWRGQPFWARLLAADGSFGGQRMLQLVYTPPVAHELAGAVLIDCPFVLLDAHARIVAWNGRDGLSRVDPFDPAKGYHVVRELHHGEGDDASPHGQDRHIAGVLGWDLHLAPLLLALAWHGEEHAAVRLVDYFGPRARDAIGIAWTTTAVTTAGESWTIEADDHRSLKRLLGPDGAEIFRVDARR